MTTCMPRPALRRPPLHGMNDFINCGYGGWGGEGGVRVFTPLYRARICKRLCSPGTDSEESIPPAHLFWRAGTTNRVAVPARQAGNRFLGPLKGLQMRALA
jgi:hypothetical protein